MKAGLVALVLRYRAKVLRHCRVLLGWRYTYESLTLHKHSRRFSSKVSLNPLHALIQGPMLRGKT